MSQLAPKTKAPETLVQDLRQLRVATRWHKGSPRDGVGVATRRLSSCIEVVVLK
jgi:hypothetical protein